MFPGDGMARDQNQFHRLRQLVLVQPEAFAQQPPRAAAGHRPADFFTGDDAELGRRARGQPVPIGDETTLGQPFAGLPDAREIAALGEPRGAAQAAAVRRGIHKLKPA